jgi:2-desacetyl-2-hydroxyethyl bacteriochlorophyllide A dehydrogenase
MKAVRLLHPGCPLEMQEMDVPNLGPYDVLVRVKAAGICHSDVHYRAGRSRVDPLPITLGHEVAGIIEAIGPEVSRCKAGERVCVHYMATCGHCHYCTNGNEQFCKAGAMIGKHRDGGYAQFIVMPERSILQLPQAVPFEHGAVLMCSSATSFHALRKARLKPAESVAIFGVGGLGLSAVQLARAMGAEQVFAVDLKPAKLSLAERFGAIPINAGKSDAVSEIQRLTGGRGVDVSLELIGLPATMRQAVQVLAIQGRAAIAGITTDSFEVASYQELINKEAEIIGVSDHLAEELPQLIDWAGEGKLDLSQIITRTIPLEAPAINETLDQLEQLTEDIRVVITV